MPSFLKFLEQNDNSDCFINPNKNSNSVIFTFGRMNPPTVGHMRNILYIRNIANGYSYDYYTFLSKSSGDSTNPLTIFEKAKYLNIFCKGNANLVYNENVNTIFDVLKYLNELGYSNIILCVGADRVDKFKKVLAEYGSSAGPAKYSVISSGVRTNNISGSAAREAVKNGDYDAFCKMMPLDVSKNVIKNLFDDVSHKLKGVFNVSKTI